MHAKADRKDSTRSKYRSQARSVLFINHYVFGESQTVHRPDRRLICSHVQKLVRHKKRIQANIGLERADLTQLCFRRRPIEPKSDPGRQAGHPATIGPPLRDLEAEKGREQSSLGNSNVGLPLAATPPFLHNDEPGPSNLRPSRSPSEDLENFPGARTVLQVCEFPPNEPLLFLESQKYAKICIDLEVTDLDSFVPQNLQSPQDAQAHVEWVVQNSLVRHELLFSVFALGASVCDASKDGSGNSDDASLVLSPAAYTVAAVTQLQFAISQGRLQGTMPVTTAYSVMCLTMTEVPNPRPRAVSA